MSRTIQWRGFRAVVLAALPLLVGVAVAVPAHAATLAHHRVPVPVPTASPTPWQPEPCPLWAADAVAVGEPGGPVPPGLCLPPVCLLWLNDVVAPAFPGGGWCPPPLPCDPATYNAVPVPDLLWICPPVTAPQPTESPSATDSPSAPPSDSPPPGSPTDRVTASPSTTAADHVTDHVTDPVTASPSPSETTCPAPDPADPQSDVAWRACESERCLADHSYDWADPRIATCLIPSGQPLGGPTETLVPAAPPTAA
jgi:hypothetical protein